MSVSSLPKVPVYSLADLKSTTDTGLVTYLSSIGVTGSHWREDVRLAMGYSMIGIAGFTFYVDRKMDGKFEMPISIPYVSKYATSSTEWLVVAVVAYCVLNLGMNLWSWIVEGDVIFEGIVKGNKIVISSKTKPYIPIYNLTIQTSGRSSALSSRTTTIDSPFSNWFTAEGEFSDLDFIEWVANGVPEVIGVLDDKRYSRRSDKISIRSAGVTGKNDPRVLDVLDPDERNLVGKKGGPVILDKATPEQVKQTLMGLKKRGGK